MARGITGAMHRSCRLLSRTCRAAMNRISSDGTWPGVAAVTAIRRHASRCAVTMRTAWDLFRLRSSATACRRSFRECNDEDVQAGGTRSVGGVSSDYVCRDVCPYDRAREYGTGAGGYRHDRRGLFFGAAVAAALAAAVAYRCLECVGAGVDRMVAVSARQHARLARRSVVSAGVVLRVLADRHAHDQARADGADQLGGLSAAGRRQPVLLGPFAAAHESLRYPSPLLQPRRPHEHTRHLFDDALHRPDAEPPLVADRSERARAGAGHRAGDDQPFLLARCRSE